MGETTAMMISTVQAVFLVVLLAVGVVCLFSPMTVIQTVMRWPKFIFPKLFRDEEIRPLAREAMRLIDENPREYARRFWYQLLMIRVSGIIAFLMFLTALLIALGSPRSGM
jgi:succinate dehydrogenase hydrophobic anchor subunit